MPETIPKSELDKVKERFKDDLALINRYFDTKESSVLYALAFTLRRHSDVIPSLIKIVRKIQSEGTPTNKGDGANYCKDIAIAAFGNSKGAARVRDVFNKFKFKSLILPVEPAYRKKKKKTAQEEAEKELGRIAKEELAERQPGLTELAEQPTEAQTEPSAERLAGPKELSALNDLGKILIKYPIYLITPETFDIILASRLQQMKEKLEEVVHPRTLKVIDFLINQLKKGA